MSKKILIYNSGGGLGDSIQLFPLILSLKKHFNNLSLYYLGAHENHFLNKLKEYNVNINSLNLNIKYFGFRWWHLLFVKKRFSALKLDKFDLIIDLQSKIRNSLILKLIPHKIFYSSTFKFKLCTQEKKYINSDDFIQNTIENLIFIFEEKIKRINYEVEKLPEKFKEEAQKLLPHTNYIGFSITQGNLYRKKSWPINNFITLANKILKKNKIPVFFIEKTNVKLFEKLKTEVPNSIIPEFDTDISCPALVTALGERLEKAISIDNGIMHMLSISKIPLIVLFGPTSSKKFAPLNDNTTILDTKKLYKSKNIEKITIDEIFNLI